MLEKGEQMSNPFFNSDLQQIFETGTASEATLNSLNALAQKEYGTYTAIDFSSATLAGLVSDIQVFFNGNTGNVKIVSFSMIHHGSNYEAVIIYINA